MLQCFPKCPICYQTKGYDVLGANKDYVSCKKCCATWQSDDFSKNEKLSTLRLTQPSKEGVGRLLLGKTFSVDYWQNWREELKAKLAPQEHARANSLLQCDNAILTNNEFLYRSNDEIFETSWHFRFDGLNVGLKLTLALCTNHDYSSRFPKNNCFQCLLNLNRENGSFFR
jgi:hypothetical protein